MDPCSFVRVLVGNLALKFPVASKPSFSGVHSSTSPCFCKIKLKNFPTQFSSVPLISIDDQNQEPRPHSLASCFSFNKIQLQKLAERGKSPSLKIEVYTGRRGSSYGVSNGAKLLGRVCVPLNLTIADSRACVFHNGWVAIGESQKSSSALLYLTVHAEPDPRFVFEFDGEPECSPQVFQLQGSLRQLVFSCKFSFRNEREREQRSRSSMSEPTCTSGKWLPKIRQKKEQPARERKGWSVTIHDLSGSPVALASMVTPFVPSPGSQRVSRSNPGAWLILQPGDGTWNPWGRLEAWRDRAGSDDVSYRIELLTGSAAAATVTTGTVSSTNGGKFTVDTTCSASPVSSPHGSFDLGGGSGSGSGSGSGDFGVGSQYRGFVMSSRMGGKGKGSKAEVEVGVQQVACTEDAAAFVALAAAMDLSLDACTLFSGKLRKELRQW